MLVVLLVPFVGYYYSQDIATTGVCGALGLLLAWVLTDPNLLAAKPSASRGFRNTHRHRIRPLSEISLSKSLIEIAQMDSNEGL